MDDDFKISILSSGSGGNCTYIETPEHKVIQDAGLSGKKLQALMQSIGKDMNDVDSLFVTHEHTDHAKAVGILARKYGMNVYANMKTWKAMAGKIGDIPDEQKFLFSPDKTMSLGDLDIESYSVAHDAAHAQFYTYHHNGKSFATLTDTGSTSDYMEGIMRDANAYLFECNYDTDMLMNGDYTYSTKMRIQSPTGHLSNVQGTDALMNMIGLDTQDIFLAHRSHHNNSKSLQRLTVASMMQNNGLAVGHDFNLYDTDVEKPSGIIEL